MILFMADYTSEGWVSKCLNTMGLPVLSVSWPTLSYAVYSPFEAHLIGGYSGSADPSALGSLAP
jgi:hypothetical protein